MGSELSIPEAVLLFVMLAPIVILLVDVDKLKEEIRDFMNKPEDD